MGHVDYVYPEIDEASQSLGLSAAQRIMTLAVGSWLNAHVELPNFLQRWWCLSQA